MNNPVYELDSVKANNSTGGGVPTLKVIQTSHLLQSQRIDSSDPLYASQSTESINDNIREQNRFVDNESLLDVLCHTPRATSVPRETSDSGLEVPSQGIRHSRSAGNFPQQNQDSSRGLGPSVEPYKEKVSFANGTARKPTDNNIDNDYEPVQVPPEEIFDDPNYEGVNY